MKPEDVSPSQFGGVVGVSLGNPDKPWRHRHHDFQPIDEVRITTVPRYKTSGLSGGEWRISARIEYMRKGRVIHERPCRNVESALRYADWWLTEFLESGNFSAGHTEGDCDQEGCGEKATVTYRLKKEYTWSEGIPHEPHRPKIIRFCERHKRRGDCGLEDNDANYVRVMLHDDGTITEVA